MAPLKSRNLTNSQREEVRNFLLHRVDSENQKNKLKSGSISEAASMFEADRQTVRRIWSQALHSIV